MSVWLIRDVEMMPPVSLPLNGGTQSALAALLMIAPLRPAAKIANRIIRITVSIVVMGTLERHRRR